VTTIDTPCRHAVSTAVDAVDDWWFFGLQEDPPVQPHKKPEEPIVQEQLVLPDINEKRKVEKADVSGRPNHGEKNSATTLCD